MKQILLAVLCIFMYNGCDSSEPGTVVSQDLVVGDGELGVVGTTWKINYKGLLEDGTVFASNAGSPSISFVFDSQSVVIGLLQGMQGMRIGGKRKITIPPDLAYGSKGLTDANGNRIVPKNATVIYEVELVGLPKLFIEDLTQGAAGTETKNGESLTVKYVGTFENGNIFDQGTFTFTLGAGSVIQGFDQGLLGMKVGGKRKLIVPPHLGYGSSGSGSIPPNTNIVFEVELVSKK
jgi:FKBP-type peptidyl-prolyl cis-trans isomerase